jgi:hypothetical protein
VPATSSFAGTVDEVPTTGNREETAAENGVGKEGCSDCLAPSLGGELGRCLVVELLHAHRDIVRFFRFTFDIDLRLPAPNVQMCTKQDGQAIERSYGPSRAQYHDRGHI